MNPLKSLSKLRQFSVGTGVDRYLSTEHRQNLLAIEQAFSTIGAGLNSGPQLILLAIALGTTVGASASPLYLITEFDANLGQKDSNTYQISEDGDYFVEYDFNYVVMAANCGLVMSISRNLTSYYSQTVGSVSSAASLNLGETLKFTLKAGDILNFDVVRSGATDVTFRRMYLKIYKK
jgi:hypothetical protein